MAHEDEIPDGWSYRSVRLTSTGCWNSVVQTHGFHECVLFLHGFYRVVCEGRQFKARPNDAFIFPAGSPHRPQNRWPPITRIDVVQWRGLEPPSGYVRVQDTHLRLRMLAVWLRDVFDARRDPELGARLLDLFVSELWRLCEEPGRRDPVDEVIAIMRGDLSREHKAADYGRAVGMSDSHLSRLFRAKTGMPLMRYQLELRLDRAEVLLVTTRLTVQEIAEEIGMRGGAYLTRQLVQKRGRTPTQIRQAHTAKARGSTRPSSASP